MAYDETTTEEILIDNLREAGFRATLPRRAVCRVLAESEKEFLNVAAILERVKASAGEIDPSTIYRTLDDLAGIGLVHQVQAGHVPGFWHLTVHHDHQHLVCEECGKTIAVPSEVFEQTYESLRQGFSFFPNGHNLAVLGYCADCEPKKHPEAESSSQIGDRPRRCR